MSRSVQGPFRNMEGKWGWSLLPRAGGDSAHVQGRTGMLEKEIRRTWFRSISTVGIKGCDVGVWGGFSEEQEGDLGGRGGAEAKTPMEKGAVHPGPAGGYRRHKSIWTENFQMYKLGLGKAEEPEIKLPTSIGSQKKQENSRKNIYFCFIDYAKAFDCVDHKKLWKILKEMGIPDHLTCVFRNLYAGDQAVRTGLGTRDWFQTGKGVHQGCILSLCLFNFYAEWKVKGLVTQSCLTLCEPRDCSPPGSSVHGFLLARILEWAAISFSRGSSWPRDWTQVSCIAGRFFTISATRERTCKMPG